MWYTRLFPFASGKKDMSSRGQKRLADYENDRQWQDVFTRLTNIALNIFEWEGLPETCDSRFFESILLFNSQACLIDDPEFGGYLTLPCTQGGAQDIYYHNPFYRAYSVNYSKPFKALTSFNVNNFKTWAEFKGDMDAPLDGVVCFDNDLTYPMVETIAIYTDKIVDTMRAIDVCQRQLKVPAIIETEPETKLAIEQALKSIDTNCIAVYAGSKVAKALSETKPIQTFANPSTLTSLWDNYNNLYSAFYTAFGINNLNTADKKERLLTNEVESNDEAIALNADYRLQSRLHFCEYVKTAFGLNLICRLRKQKDEPTPGKETNANNSINNGLLDMG